MAHPRGISVRKADESAPFAYTDLDLAQAALRDALRFLFTWQTAEGAALFFTKDAVEEVAAAYAKELALGPYVNPLQMTDVTWEEQDGGLIRATGRLIREQQAWAGERVEGELGRVVVTEFPKAFVDLEKEDGRWKLSGDLRSDVPFVMVALSSTKTANGPGRTIHAIATSNAALRSVTLKGEGQSAEMVPKGDNKFSGGVILTRDPSTLVWFDPFVFHFAFEDGTERLVEYRYDVTFEYPPSKP